MISKKWGGISAKEAKSKLEGWKNGTLNDADKQMMDELVKGNQGTFNKAKEARKTFEKKKGPKLDLWDEIDKLDDTITGGIRSKMKDSNKKNENPLYALIGDELKKTRYSKRHKQREEEDATKDAKKKRAAELAASTILDAEMRKSAIEANLELNEKIELSIKHELAELNKKGNNLTPEEVVYKNHLEQELAKFANQAAEYKAQALQSKEVLEKISKMKDINPKKFESVREELNDELEKIKLATGDLKQLRANIEAALKYKKAP